MTPVSRRQFVRTAALLAAASRTPLTEASPVPPQAAPRPADPARPGAAPVRWLGGAAPAAFAGATWGVPWPFGRHAAGTEFTMLAADGAPIPLQTWPLATWPDGSLKWTGHAVGGEIPAGESFDVVPGAPATPPLPLTVTESAEAFVVDTGVLRVHIARRGAILVPEVRRGGAILARAGRLVCLLEARAGDTRTIRPFAGEIESATLEQSGPIRAVVRLEGRHADADRRWLPFVVRLHLHAGGEAVRVLHTITFDGDQERDFITGLGLRFDVVMRGALHDRHVRFSGEGEGIFGEAVRGLTGLRRDPGAAVRRAQIAGAVTPPTGEWDRRVADRLEFIPAYDDWTLVQPGADGFQIRKRTREGFTWLTAAQGVRAGGMGYVGGPEGGLCFGLRNFWQSHPAQLDIRGATTDAAQATVWMWAPEAPAMDLRSYHDGLGQDTYAKQYNGGLEITYEDYEPGFDSPEGVARTSELLLHFVASTPGRARLAALAEAVRRPPVLVTTPGHLSACGVFGGADVWAPADRSSPAREAIERGLDARLDYYLGQQEQRRWFGYWNFGDVMHTYDVDRHEWRYDVGGYAWDNSELSTDIWLWLHFLRTGRADAFRFAEAMTRHTGEVDVHHLGRFAPLGSRHNVLHWGCSAKQLRISTAVNRRYFYYLTADERTGDLMRAQVEAGHALLRIPPTRKLAIAETAGDLAREISSDPTRVGLAFGTDWGSLAGAWLTEWERTGDPAMRSRLVEGMRTIGAQPHGFFTTGATFNLETGAFAPGERGSPGASHLSAVFGLVEVCAELNQLLEAPEFRKAWLEYCELYNADAAVQEARLGRGFPRSALRQGHSRLTAHAAVKLGRPDLAARAWTEFRGGADHGGLEPRIVRIEGPAVLRPVDEAREVSTNGAAQWGLAAIQCLALIGDRLPPGDV